MSFTCKNSTKEFSVFQDELLTDQVMIIELIDWQRILSLKWIL